MTFRHVPAEWQPSLVTKILELAEQAANHRVTPERIIEFDQGRLEELRTISVPTARTTPRASGSSWPRPSCGSSA